ncbi:MAG: GtrA family protein [Myxococcales bacterium]
MKMKNPRQLLAAGLGGVAATALDVGVLVLLVAHHLAIPLAAFIAALAGAAVTFVINKYVAFRDRSPITLPQLLRFNVVVVVAALLMAAAMKLVAVRLGVPIVIAKLGCAALVFAIWTYPTQRRFVFAQRVVGP